uniref:Uncharacterized protein n=1 Tax=Romanomermis culicivorax TaxID=13658 RepID=A0A915KH90_ROMCU
TDSKIKKLETTVAELQTKQNYQLSQQVEGAFDHREFNEILAKKIILDAYNHLFEALDLAQETMLISLTIKLVTASLALTYLLIYCDIVQPRVV